MQENDKPICTVTIVEHNEIAYTQSSAMWPNSMQQYTMQRQHELGSLVNASTQNALKQSKIFLLYCVLYCAGGRYNTTHAKPELLKNCHRDWESKNSHVAEGISIDFGIKCPATWSNTVAEHWFGWTFRDMVLLVSCLLPMMSPRETRFFAMATHFYRSM